MSLSLSVDVLGKYKTDIFVETGTHLGGGITTALFVGFKDIYSIEIDLNKYNKIKDLLKYNESVHLYLGDSKDILPKLLSNLSKERITFFLDAHSDDYNPLLYELYIIKNSPRNDHIILIDDRRMMGNQNYQCWKYITEEDVIRTLKEINPNYNIEYENSFNSLKDIIVAWTPQDGIIDKLFTSSLKMWHNQELLYKIRRMTLDDFLREFNNEIEMKKLYEWLKRASDLNIQRNQLIDEIDKLIVQMIKDALEGKELDDGKYIQRKHKTY